MLRPPSQWKVMHEAFLAHERKIEADAAAVAEVGKPIEMLTKAGSYTAVRLGLVHRDGTIDVAWFNRLTRKTERRTRQSRTLFRTIGSTPYLLRDQKMKIARAAGLLNFKGVGCGIDEVGMLYKEWKRARREAAKGTAADTAC